MMRTVNDMKAFTLLEAVISMAILSIGAYAMLGMLSMSLFTARANALDSHAVGLAIQEREDIRALVYTAMASRDRYQASAPNVFNGVAFTTHSDVQNDQPALSMKTVTVTVSWSYRGTPRSYSLAAIYTNLNG